MVKFGLWRKAKISNVRRNAHLSTGGQKSTTFRYSSNRMASDRGFDRGAAERQQAHSQKLAQRLRSLPYTVGLACLMLGAIYLSTLSTIPQIVISGNQQLVRDKSTYQSKAQQLLASKFQHRFKAGLNGQELALQLQDSFAELSSVDISTPLLRHRPVIELVISAPAVVFVSGEHTYLIDERGIVLFDLKDANHGVDTTKLPVLSDQTSFTAEVNKPALTIGQVNFIKEIVHQLSAKKLEISSMELVSGGGELDIRLKGAGYKVKFNFYEEGRRSAGAFLAAKEQVEREGVQPNEYIDVRIPTRAYVK